MQHNRPEEGQPPLRILPLPQRISCPAEKNIQAPDCTRAQQERDRQPQPRPGILHHPLCRHEQGKRRRRRHHARRKAEADALRPRADPPAKKINDGCAQRGHQKRKQNSADHKQAHENPSGISVCRRDS